MRHRIISAAAIARVPVILARPGTAAWSVAGAAAVVAGLLPATAVGRLAAAVGGVTALLLLATARAWRDHRPVAESALLVSGLLVAGLLAARAPAMLQLGLTPLLMVGAAWVILAGSEWRFAPDFGQQGFSWALAESVPAALWAGLGVGLAMLVGTVLHMRSGCPAVVILAGGAVLGRGLGFALEQPRGRGPQGAARVGQRTNIDPADWWRQAG